MGRSDLTLPEIKKVSASMKDFFFLNIGGGEPFTRKDLPLIVEIFYKNNHIQNLLIPTNGTLTKAVITSTQKILNLCPDLKVSIDVSIDGVGKLHNQIREGKDVYVKALKTLKLLIALKKKFKNLQVGTITTHMYQNQKYLNQIYDYLKDKVRPDSITIALTRGKPRDPKSGKINIDYYRKLNKKMESDFLKGNITGFRKIFLWPLIIATKILMHRLVIDTYDKGYQYPCLAGQLNVVIYSNGDVYPCEMLADSKLGNLRKVNYDFQQLWETEKLKSIVLKIKRTKCFCTHECHLPINILYSPKSLLKLLFISIKLLISPNYNL
jgi:radical SAM protein with 4Fe4S-binding SPASM domain